MTRTCIPVDVQVFRAIGSGGEYSITGEVPADKIPRGEIITVACGNGGGERMTCEVIEDPVELDPDFSSFKIRRI